jgi:hypothetical protein
MIGCLLRGSEGVYKPRSQAGLGEGSHSTIQRVVGRLIQPVQPAYERMDSVQGWPTEGCLASGGWQAQHTGGWRQSGGGWSAAGIDTPCPPPLTIGGGGFPEIFLPFFLTRGTYPPFFQLNDNQP